jgi:SAM-dependent methyltransferase
MKCRHCQSSLSLELVDLGTAPPSNAYLTGDQRNAPERYYPLKVLVCESCWLAQTRDFSRAEELFDENYAYFSSYSSSWLAHAKNYVESISPRLGLGKNSLVMEVAANDGYLLQFFNQRGVPCFGVEPTKSTADVARSKGIDIVGEFFGQETARFLADTRGKVDLALGNNVLAHVPDINDFVAGFRRILKPKGVLTLEFPHLLNLIQLTQFDTIYHEHYSYLSLLTVRSILRSQGLTVFDVEQLATHGGSLRVYAHLSDTGDYPISESVQGIIEREEQFGLTRSATYQDFARRAFKIKLDLLSALVRAKGEGKRIAAYGAAAKGNTLLNYAGVGADIIDYVVDRNPHKQGKFMPGSRIPIVGAFSTPEPDIVLILPWNIKDEITDSLKGELSSSVLYWTYICLS